MRHGNELGALREQSFVIVELELTGRIARNHLDDCARFFGNELPRNDVGVMFQDGDDDFVTRLECRLHVGICNQVNGFGRTAYENNFLRRRSSDKVTNDVACIFVGVCRCGRERVSATVNVGVLVFVVVLEAVNDDLRALRRCTVIEPNERMAVDLLRKNREVRTDLGKRLGTDADGIVARICAAVCRTRLHGIATERSRCIDLAASFGSLRLGHNLRGVTLSRCGGCRNIAQLRCKLRFGNRRGFNRVEPGVCRTSAIGKRSRGCRLVAIGRKGVFPVEGWSLADGCGTLSCTDALSGRCILRFGSGGGCCVCAIRQIREIRICQLLQFSRIGNSGEFFQRSGFWIIRSHSIRQPRHLLTRR